MPNNLAAKTFAVLLVMTACGQDYNSNSGDEIYAKRPASPSLDCTTSEGGRLCGAINILRDKCFSCHIDMADFETDAAWVASGRVSPGNSEGSTIVTKLINAGGNMPQGGSALPDSDYQALRAWVDQMQPSGG